jgi:PAS domain S-box-containing protein
MVAGPRCLVHNAPLPGALAERQYAVSLTFQYLHGEDSALASGRVMDGPRGRQAEQIQTLAMQKPGLSTAPESLRQSEDALLQLLFNGVTEYAIFMLDPQGIVTSWNTGAERIKGYRAEEIVGKHFSLFYTEEDRQAGVPARALKTALERGVYAAQSWRLRKGGSPFMAEVLIEPLRDPQGRLAGFAKLTRDVSERVQQQKALEESRSALVRLQKLADLGPMSAVAHDLNNLLQVIRNGAELVRRRVGTADSETVSLLDVVRRNADSAARLTQQLLKMARGRQMEPASINLNETVAGMAELIRQWLSERVTIETVLAGGLWETSADAEQLKTAILNLVVNARNALPDSGKLTIETRNVRIDDAHAKSEAESLPTGDYVTIAVRDGGTGMSGEIIAKALSAASADGTQLGMSQVQGFVRQAGGHLRIESTPGEGTTVCLYLPRTDPERTVGAEVRLPAHGVATSAVAMGTGAISLAGLRVLVIEDEALIAIFVEDLLDQLGCALVGVMSRVGQGLEAIQGTQFDIALLDINVGGEPVYALAEALQKRGVPMVFMSGHLEIADAWRDRPRVQKPFDLEQLRMAMERAVRS